MSQKYSVSIYPKGVDSAGVELLFNTQEEHTQYVRQEARYCCKEQAAYMGELYSKDERARKKNLFYQKRAEFARKAGFKSVNSSQWRRQAAKGDPNTPLGVA